MLCGLDLPCWLSALEAALDHLVCSLPSSQDQLVLHDAQAPQALSAREGRGHQDLGTCLLVVIGMLFRSRPPQGAGQENACVCVPRAVHA